MAETKRISTVKVPDQTGTEVVPYDIDAKFFGGQDKNYYLNYNNLSNKPDLSSYATESWVKNSAPIPEANLTWGGKNFKGSYGPIDAAMIPDLGANRFAFLKLDGIHVEYSRDNGVTWLNYHPDPADNLKPEEKQAIINRNNNEKLGLFGTGSSISIGKTSVVSKNNPEKYFPDKNCQLRIIIETKKAGIYTALNKFALYISTEGTANNTVDIDARLASSTNENDYVSISKNAPLSGWSGWNIINIPSLTTYGNSPTVQYGFIRFTFKCTGYSSTSPVYTQDDFNKGKCVQEDIGKPRYRGLVVYRMMAFGGVGWSCPSDLARTGHLYTYDNDQNAFFPKSILPKLKNSSNLGSSSYKWANVYATTFNGNLTGNVTGDVTGNAASANQVNNAISFTAGQFGGNDSFDGSVAKTIKIPTSTKHLTNDSNFVTKDEIGNVYKFKGCKASIDELDQIPIDQRNHGDVWNVTSDGMNYAWVDATKADCETSHWDSLGRTNAPDLSDYLSKSQGGTMESAITIGKGDGNGILFGDKTSNINIIDGGGSKTLVGFLKNGTDKEGKDKFKFVISNSLYQTQIRGSDITLNPSGNTADAENVILSAINLLGSDCNINSTNLSVKNTSTNINSTTFSINSPTKFIVENKGNAGLSLKSYACSNDYAEINTIASDNRVLFLQSNKNGYVNIGGVPSQTAGQQKEARLMIYEDTLIALTEEEQKTKTALTVRGKISTLDLHTNNIIGDTIFKDGKFTFKNRTYFEQAIILGQGDGNGIIMPTNSNINALFLKDNSTNKTILGFLGNADDPTFTLGHNSFYTNIRGKTISLNSTSNLSLSGTKTSIKSGGAAGFYLEGVYATHDYAKLGTTDNNRVLFLQPGTAGTVTIGGDLSDATVQEDKSAKLIVNGSTQISGNLLPKSNTAVNLGSDTNPFREITCNNLICQSYISNSDNYIDISGSLGTIRLSNGKTYNSNPDEKVGILIDGNKGYLSISNYKSLTAYDETIRLDGETGCIDTLFLKVPGNIKTKYIASTSTRERDSAIYLQGTNLVPSKPHMVFMNKDKKFEFIDSSSATDVNILTIDPEGISHDGKKFKYPSQAGTIALISDIAASGGGDVSSASSSSTDGKVVVASGTTGKEIKMLSDVSINDTGITKGSNTFTFPSKAGTIALTTDTITPHFMSYQTESNDLQIEANTIGFATQLGNNNNEFLFDIPNRKLIMNNNGQEGQSCSFEFPKKSGTFALTSDIPSVSSYITSSNTSTTADKVVVSADTTGKKIKMLSNIKMSDTGITKGSNTFTFPSKAGTFALTSEIPDLTDYIKTSMADNSTSVNKVVVAADKSGKKVKMLTNVAINETGIQYGAKEYTWPNAAGQLALVSQVPSNLDSLVTFTGTIKPSKGQIAMYNSTDGTELSTCTGMKYSSNTLRVSTALEVGSDATSTAKIRMYGSLGAIYSDKIFTPEYLSNTGEFNFYKAELTAAGDKIFGVDATKMYHLTYDYTLPTKSGTIALTSDIPNSVTLPDNIVTGSGTTTAANKLVVAADTTGNKIKTLSNISVDDSGITNGSSVYSWPASSGTLLTNNSVRNIGVVAHRAEGLVGFKNNASGRSFELKTTISPYGSAYGDVLMLTSNAPSADNLYGGSLHIRDGGLYINGDIYYTRDLSSNGDYQYANPLISYDPDASIAYRATPAYVFGMPNIFTPSTSEQRDTIVQGGVVAIRSVDKSKSMYLGTSGWVTDSDARCKDIYKTNPVENAADIVKNIDTIEYTYKEAENKDDKIFGTTTQSVIKASGEYSDYFVDQTNPDHHLIKESGLLYLALAAIKDQQKQIEKQQEEINLLKEAIQLLKEKESK